MRDIQTDGNFTGQKDMITKINVFVLLRSENNYSKISNYFPITFRFNSETN